MVSEKQHTANRRNARKSTGPKTAGGLAKAARNALTHGLCSARPVLPGEPAGDWDRHRAGVVAALAPVGPLEEALADRVAACQWRLRRAQAFETAATVAGLEEAADPGPPDPDDRHTPAGRDARRLAKIAAELAETRKTEAVWADTAELHDRLPGLPDDAPVGAEAVEGLFSDVNGAVPGAADSYFDFDDPDFLADLGVPAAVRDRPFAWGGWTAGLVRAAVAAAAEEFEIAAADLLARAKADRAESQRESAEGVAKLTAEARAIRGRAEGRTRRAVLRHLLPDAATLDKVARYEAHLARQLTHALDTLERLQVARAGRETPPPAPAGEAPGGG